MPVIAVMYPSGNDTTFDHDYYMKSHMPLVQKLWSPLGLQGATVMRGIAGPDGAAPTYVVITQLTFASMDAFKDAGAKHGGEIFADIPKFTNSAPLLQFNEVA